MLSCCNLCRARLEQSSFPTRRSSDLGSQPRLGPRVRSRSSLGSHHDRTRRQRATSITTRVGPVREYTENGVPCAATPMKDRKSTRLNSSHVSISYAVFCLKKKNLNKIHNAILNDHTLPVHGNSTTDVTA